MRKIREMILTRIRKNAERGAGMVSERGVFEGKVPEKLKKGDQRFYENEKTLIKRKKWLAALCLCIALCFSGVTSFAGADVKSNDTIGGVYAYGHSGYSSSSASAYTKHQANSYKTVRVRGTYRKSNTLYATYSSTVVSTSSADAIASAPTPSGGTMIGAFAWHSMSYLGTSWSGSTFVGVQYE